MSGEFHIAKKLENIDNDLNDISKILKHIAKLMELHILESSISSWDERGKLIGRMDKIRRESE